MSNTTGKSTQKLVRSKGPELLAYLGAVTADQLKKEGVESRKAEEISVRIIGHMTKEFGGQSVYFPMNIQKDTEAKTAAIYDKWYAGAAINELANEYGHSIIWIYKLIANERAYRRAKRDEEQNKHRAIEQMRWQLEN